MEVKIGMINVNRELSFDSGASKAELLSQVEAALTQGTPLVLTDAKERTVVVPAAVIAYVQIGEHEHGRVGFVPGS